MANQIMNLASKVLMHLSKYSLTVSLILTIAGSVFQNVCGQKIEGSYIGKIGSKNALLELQSSNGLIVGIVQWSAKNKWFFTANAVNNGFDGYSTLGLTYDAFVKGTIKDDSLFLTVITPDSTHNSQFS